MFGDWGQVDAGGNNLGQAKVMSQIARSGATFAVTTGDTGYPSGSQTNYGDLVQHGADTSAIFGRHFWAKAGDRIPLFNAQGNHGMNAAALVNWPQGHTRAASRGRYSMQLVPGIWTVQATGAIKTVPGKISVVRTVRSRTLNFKLTLP